MCTHKLRCLTVALIAVRLRRQRGVRRWSPRLAI
jgi:hypothetical protein